VSSRSERRPPAGIAAAGRETAPRSESLLGNPATSRCSSGTAKFGRASGGDLRHVRAVANSLAEQKQFARNVTEKENLPETRGGNVNGVTVHSVRLPGRSAHHEVVFGAAGQTVTLRHDTLGRDCYMPGVVRCIREAAAKPGLVVGLENVLGL